MEFKSFGKIENLKRVEMSITQKIHGTNAQIFIYPATELMLFCSEEALEGCLKQCVEKMPNETFTVIREGVNQPAILRTYLELRAGSRTRWIFPGDDNYGFAAWAEKNKAELIEKLGPGQHFGEWAGPGINSGEGLEKKTFVLFDWWKYPAERPLPPDTVVVPLLYRGELSADKIEEVFQDLKTNGSKLAPGFMRPEGIVVQLAGTRYKKVFEAEETQWTKGSKVKAPPVDKVDVSHLLQPIRLEKLLSKDERYLREYPKSLPQICSAYVADLIEEGQITGDSDQISATKKAMGSQTFGFIKQFIEALK